MAVHAAVDGDSDGAKDDVGAGAGMLSLVEKLRANAVKRVGRGRGRGHTGGRLARSASLRAGVPQRVCVRTGGVLGSGVVVFVILSVCLSVCLSTSPLRFVFVLV